MDESRLPTKDEMVKAFEQIKLQAEAYEVVYGESPDWSSEYINTKAEKIVLFMHHKAKEDKKDAKGAGFCKAIKPLAATCS